MGNWYLVRHGETEWNRIGRMQGHVNAPLSRLNGATPTSAMPDAQLRRGRLRETGQTLPV